MFRFLQLLLLAGMLGPIVALSCQVDVLDVALRAGERVGHFDIDVTLRHADTGWDHYANRWEVIGPDGRVLATRVLYHPHVNEQPFTRSETIQVPAGTAVW